MANQDSGSKGSVKITIVNALPSPDYQPTVHLAMLRVVVRGKLASTVVIQRHDSAVPGQEPVWKPLPDVVATQAPQLIIVPGMSHN
jgi:hypothetical protein